MKNQYTELPEKVKLSIIKKATQKANKYQTDIVNEYNMKKLEELKKVIQNSNPSIMELKFGCVFRFRFQNDRIISDRKIEKGNFFKIINVKKNVQYLGSNKLRIQGKIETFKILGRPITFFDIVGTIDPFGNYGYIAGHLAKINRKEGTYSLKCKWNKEDDNLDNQTKETKQFLIDLLVK